MASIKNYDMEKLRKDLGLSFQKLADYLAIYRERLHRAENGLRSFPVECAVKYAQLANAWQKSIGSKEPHEKVKEWLKKLESDETLERSGKLAAVRYEHMKLKRKLVKMEKE